MHVADVGQFVFGEVVVHVLLMIDEASRFAVAHELYRQPKTEQRNPTSQEIILALERSWIAYHGLPNVLRTDLRAVSGVLSWKSGQRLAVWS